jgi:hypothetical protein
LWTNLKSYLGICMERLCKTAKNLSLDSQSLGQDLNPLRLERETGVLALSDKDVVGQFRNRQKNLKLSLCLTN